MTGYNLSRFTQAHRLSYDRALREIRNGVKESHWMWYIFPQVIGLGHSETSQYYAIRSLGEAWAFANDPYLGGNLREITQAVLDLRQHNAREIFGVTDEKKLRSCMTLFAFVCEDNQLFLDVLDQYFDGRRDPGTQAIIESLFAALRRAREQAAAQNGVGEEGASDE